MEPTMIKFPSIRDFKKFSKHMKGTYRGIKTIDAIGTVKLHGAHVDVVGFFENGTLQRVQYQSRNLVLVETNTMYGVFEFLEARKATLEDLLRRAYSIAYIEQGKSGSQEIILLAGEFIGENVQPNVALQQLSKRFVIFNMLSNYGWSTVPLPVQAGISATESLIFHIAQAPQYQVTVDLKTGAGLDKFEELVNRIETECPFAAMFGVDGLGESAVFKVQGYEQDPDAWFKVKGLQHRAAIIRDLRPKTENEIAQMYENAATFAQALVATRRLEQGIEFLVESKMDTKIMRSFPEFSRWVQEDAWKEENDEIRQSGFDWTLLRKKITILAREYYESRLPEVAEPWTETRNAHIT